MAYPANFPNFLLTNSLTCSTTISLVGGMQVATIQFNNQAGLLGTITLSPVQPAATDVEFKRGNQVVYISRAYFQAAFGLTQGQVTVTGTSTDPDGKDLTPFQGQVASWSN
ncbi:MAG: hypothetical protein PSV16_04920 [Flavobacterium sp.]|nr:hypothetical protein [Flavobacterium sp.]